MSDRKRYRRKPSQPIVAVQLKLDTDGFKYHKWGGEQRCKANDWLVDNGGEVYTVDAESFARTYTALTLGTYVKTSRVWAERAVSAGRVTTNEGSTGYEAGDWLVSNGEDGSDAYSISAEKFEKLYELDE
ncbi:hypothetical protein SAMN04489798_0276 [Pseudomonas arsenicoxydans]|uniref:Uncharacterized protein n=1 Tax=Pseudomonas arsenicoxydans TaxID=702115 RepID=A0A1H0BAG1_9PSED|nr:hypothetical protein [Pseudomonas arsenicoxydans]SDN42619.1 hypothetical protein SAMN04489798_0276 [Pseudomonas arsenicoxydans]